jgi:branched-chain amino acid transport system substrate-binding protein
MSMRRRQVLSGGTAAGVLSVAGGLAKPAIAAPEPIRIGYLPALTGPSSSTGIGINRGTQLAIEGINAAGGIDGRKIELIVRDTQSDPTKAVNAVAELTQRQKVSVIWGPLNSGEALAATPLIARDKVPMLHPCWVDQLIDVKKYPMSFRNAPTNTQVGRAANHYVVGVLKLKKVAVISDTTGYGTASVETYVPMLKAMGADVVYSGHVDAANPDLKPELLRMQNAGAQAIMPWSVNAGFLSRILNTRGAMGWDVPVVGHHARRDGLGRSGRRPDDARFRPDQGTAGEARELEQGLFEQLPQLLLRRRQAAGARPGIRRPAAQRQDRNGRHAPVVDRARLGWRAPDRRHVEGRRHQA